MDIRSEIKAFLTSRRARINPGDVGVLSYGERRVPGLRREEVAGLSGVSVPYYTRLERGQAGGVSDGVLNALARTLRLDDIERSHLFALMRAVSSPAMQPPRPRVRTISPALQLVLDSIDAPAFVRNRHLDVVGANELARALYLPAFHGIFGPVNSARFVFTDPRSRAFYGDWDGIASEAVAALHQAIARDPQDPGLNDLVDELSLRSEQFRLRWSHQDVRYPVRGVKVLHHPAAGAIPLTFEPLEAACDDGVTLFACTAPPRSPAAVALRQLGDWARTRDLEYPRAPAPLAVAR